MAQKKAFVRYAQNKAVPGSLIVRTKAPKVGTWKEVPYDLCCGGGENCTIVRNVSDLDYPFAGLIQLQLNNSSCENNVFEIFLSYSINTISTVQNINDLINILNASLSYLGTFFISGEQEISLKVSNNISVLCSCTGAPFNDTMTINFL
jgi:hypothetical protein